MNVNKSHKKSPLKPRGASKPIERVSTKKLIDSIKRDIKEQVEKAKTKNESEDK